MFEGPLALKLSGVKAGSGLTTAAVQYKFVKLSADNTVVLCAGANDIPCGVLQAPVPATGDPAIVVAIGETLVQADASVTAGQLIATSTDGQCQVAVSGQYTAGQAINVAGATTAGNLFTAVINCTNLTAKA